MNMSPRSSIRRPSTIEKYSTFHPLQGLSATNFTSEKLEGMTRNKKTLRYEAIQRQILENFKVKM